MTNVEFEITSTGRNIRTFSESAIQLEDIAKANIGIIWHSHPTDGVFSDADAELMEQDLDLYPNKPVYFIIFDLGQNRSNWYQAKPI